MGIKEKVGSCMLSVTERTFFFHSLEKMEEWNPGNTKQLSIADIYQKTNKKQQ